MILLNAFSANMLAEFPASVEFTEVTAKNAAMQLLLAAESDGEAEMIRSAVGHQDTANIFASILGVHVPCNRATVSLRPGDTAILGQYIGPRLPEGATALPAGSRIVWLLVEVSK